jgi:hypothetical protein
MKRLRPATEEDERVRIIYSWHGFHECAVPELPGEMWTEVLQWADPPTTLALAKVCPWLHGLVHLHVKKCFLAVYTPYTALLRQRNWSVYEADLVKQTIAAKHAFWDFMFDPDRMLLGKYCIKTNCHGGRELSQDEVTAMLLKAGYPPNHARMTYILDHGPHTAASLYLISGKGARSSNLSAATHAVWPEDPVSALAFFLLRADDYQYAYYLCREPPETVVQWVMRYVLADKVLDDMFIWDSFARWRSLAGWFEGFFFGERDAAIPVVFTDGLKLTTALNTRPVPPLGVPNLWHVFVTTVLSVLKHKE